MSTKVGTRKFTTNQVIFHEGESGSLAYVILTGRVEISRADSRRDKEVLAVLGKDDVFGELALIDNSPRAATATALEDVICSTIDKQLIQKKVQEADKIIQILFKLMLNIIRNSKKRQEGIDKTEAEAEKEAGNAKK